MDYILGFLIGVIMTSLIYLHRNTSKRIGYLRVDYSDPIDGPYLFLELSENINNISKKREAIVEIKNKSFIPHN